MKKRIKKIVKDGNEYHFYNFSDWIVRSGAVILIGLITLIFIFVIICILCGGR